MGSATKPPSAAARSLRWDGRVTGPLRQQGSPGGAARDGGSNGPDIDATGTTKTVLIADDEPSMRLLVVATIASDRYRVVEAADGDAAWAMLRAHRPVVALLDVQMPGQTGLELTRAIKRDSELAGTHVILLTAKGQDLDVEAGFAAGADQYLTKPFSPLELLTLVEASVAGS